MRAVWWMLCLADPSVAGRLALGGGGRSAAAARRLVFTLAPRGECLYESRIGDSHPTGPLLRQFSLYSIANTFAHMLEPYGQFLPRVSCVGNIPRGCAPLGCSLHTPHSVGISPYVTRFAQVLLHCLTRSDVTSVERGVRMSQCGQAPLGMRIEGVGDSHFS